MHIQEDLACLHHSVRISSGTAKTLSSLLKRGWVSVLEHVAQPRDLSGA